MRAWWLWCWILLPGCPAPSVPVGPPPTLADGRPALPPPFSAAQLREGLPPGTVVSFRTQRQGQPEILATWTVIAHTPDGATFRFDDVVAGQAQPARERGATWEELRSHALFDASTASRDEAQVAGPLGDRRALRYVVPTPHGTETYYFDPQLPGPPVLLVVQRDGREVHRMEMTAHRRP